MNHINLFGLLDVSVVKTFLILRFIKLKLKKVRIYSQLFILVFFYFLLSLTIPYQCNYLIIII